MSPFGLLRTLRSVADWPMRPDRGGEAKTRAQEPDTLLVLKPNTFICLQQMWMVAGRRLEVHPRQSSAVIHPHIGTRFLVLKPTLRPSRRRQMLGVVKGQRNAEKAKQQQTFTAPTYLLYRIQQRRSFARLALLDL